MGSIGPWQVVLIVAVVLLLFGGRKIPELMRGLGKGVKEFKDATQGKDDDDRERERRRDNDRIND
jgi:sec-independent protein translocase protein TatA